MTTASRPQRVAIYTRVSLDREGTSRSPERQEAECRRLAEGRGWSVARVFSDRNLSAFKRGVHRPEYERLLEAVRAGEVDAVVVYSLSRLARSTRELVRVMDVLEDHGCVLAAVADNVDTSSATGRAMTQIVGVFAQLEADQTRERVTSAHARAAEQGRMHGGGSRRFGYTREAEVVPEEAAVVREVYERALAGESFWRLAQDLNERGVTTTTGGQWYARTVKQMVTGPQVAGLRRHNGVIHRGTWEPILTEEEYGRLLEAVTRTPAARRSVRRHLLTGLVRCGLCGGDMKTMGFRLKNGQPFERYQCVKQPGHPNCGKVAVAKGSLDEFVTGSVLDFVARASMTAGDESAAGEVDRLGAEVADDERALTELTMQRFVHRTLGQAEFEEARAALTERHAANEARLVELRRLEEERASALRPGDREALQRWWDEATVEDRRAALRAALHEVRVHPAKRRGGNRFDTGRVELIWRLDFYRRAGASRWAAMTDEEREAARQAYDSEVTDELERVWAEEDAAQES